MDKDFDKASHIFQHAFKALSEHCPLVPHGNQSQSVLEFALTQQATTDTQSSLHPQAIEPEPLTIAVSSNRTMNPSSQKRFL